MRIESWIKGSLGLGVLALVAVAVAHLALTDIYHGENDVSQEWSAVGVCFGVIIVAQVTSLITFTKMLRRKPA